MKNKIFLSIAIAAITAVAAVNVSIGLNSQKEELSALEMANVEALANGESGSWCSQQCNGWKGNSGGGIACDCKRYVGQCTSRCS